MPIMLGALARTIGGLVGARGAIAAGARGAAQQIPRVVGRMGAAGPLIGGVLGGAAAGYPWGRGAMMPRRRRAKGITAAELRGARKVAALVRMYGMKPKAGRIGKRRGGRC